MKRASLLDMNQQPVDPAEAAPADLTDRLLGRKKEVGTLRGKKTAPKKATTLKRPAPKKKPPAGAKRKTRATTSTNEATPIMNQKPSVPYEEPLPFIPYRPVPPSSAPPRPTAAEARLPDMAQLNAAMELVTQAAVALRQAAGPEFNTNVAVRARLDSLANHIEEVAKYLTRVHR